MAEKLARDKEERFAAETKASTRKQEIQKRLTDIADEESEVCAKNIVLVCCISCPAVGPVSIINFALLFSKFAVV